MEDPKSGGPREWRTLGVRNPDVGVRDPGNGEPRAWGSGGRGGPWAWGAPGMGTPGGVGDPGRPAPLAPHRLRGSAGGGSHTEGGQAASQLSLSGY